MFTVFGIGVFILGMVAANGAPQECSAAAMALCIAGLPYMLYRIQWSEQSLQNQRRIIALLETKKQD